jgi:hypothetical protein
MPAVQAWYFLENGQHICPMRDFGNLSNDEAEGELRSGIILPTQYYSRSREAGSTAGERRLMLAILMDAINCILTRGRHEQLRRDAWEWVLGGSEPFLSQRHTTPWAWNQALLEQH